MTGLAPEQERFALAAEPLLIGCAPNTSTMALRNQERRVNLVKRRELLLVHRHPQHQLVPKDELPGSSGVLA